MSGHILLNTERVDDSVLIGIFVAWLSHSSLASGFESTTLVTVLIVDAHESVVRLTSKLDCVAIIFRETVALVLVSVCGFDRAWEGFTRAWVHTTWIIGTNVVRICAGFNTLEEVSLAAVFVHTPSAERLRLITIPASVAIANIIVGVGDWAAVGVAVNIGVVSALLCRCKSMFALVNVDDLAHVVCDETRFRFTSVLKSVSLVNCANSRGVVAIIVFPAFAESKWIKKSGAVEITRRVNTGSLVSANNADNVVSVVVCNCNKNGMTIIQFHTTLVNVGTVVTLADLVHA
jgi:hypothetical protein